ncbi:MAG: hypothetical protein ROZ37_15985 [Aromatoleum sp.]|jgi:hypothetical protein|uniref:hypothetical protein n=1 Tax=Aromatoleum sp. TaxID=2307007 RepID=UPI0028939D52|nr:hypothetical protein [Aromatoleum sp.]MDT3671817.1 hypothetical protein [Aromatoleum sp.]
MSRKPAHLEMSGGKSPRQRVWEAVRGLVDYEGGFTAADASRASKVELGIVAEYLKALHAGGYLGRHDAARKGEPHRYWLERDNGIEAPRLRRDGSEVTAGRGNENMWQAMRHFLPTFDFRELAAYASTAEHPVLPDTAKAFVLTLHAAGYLEEITPAKRGCQARPARFALRGDMNTGPRPPMIQRTKAVFDANLGRVMWHEEPEWEGAQ